MKTYNSSHEIQPAAQLVIKNVEQLIQQCTGQVMFTKLEALNREISAFKSKDVDISIRRLAIMNFAIQHKRMSNMFKMRNYGGRDLPIEVSRIGGELDRFFAQASSFFPIELSFVKAEHVRRAAACATDALYVLGLPQHYLNGAVLLHVERGGNPDALVRPVVYMRLRRRRHHWFVERLNAGAAFALQPIPEGITLTFRQHAFLLGKQSLQRQSRSGQLEFICAAVTQFMSDDV